MKIGKNKKTFALVSAFLVAVVVAVILVAILRKRSGNSSGSGNTGNSSGSGNTGSSSGSGNTGSSSGSGNTGSGSGSGNTGSGTSSTVSDTILGRYCAILRVATYGWGTNEEKIYGVFRNIKKRNDILRLISAYKSLYGDNLVTLIREELTRKELEKLNGIIKANGVNYSF